MHLAEEVGLAQLGHVARLSSVGSSALSCGSVVLSRQVLRPRDQVFCVHLLALDKLLQEQVLVDVAHAEL